MVFYVLLYEWRSVTGLTLEYERMLTPLKSLGAAEAKACVDAPFTSGLLLTGGFTEVVKVSVK